MGMEMFEKMMEKFSDPKQLIKSMLPIKTQIQIRTLRLPKDPNEYIAILIAMPKEEETKE